MSKRLKPAKSMQRKEKNAEGESRWSDLAAGVNLPASIAMDIWTRGDSQARIRLAGLRDLPEEIEEAVVTSGDEDLLASWLRERRSAKLLRCVDHRIGERVRSSLATQPELGERERRAIAENEEESVLLALLARQDLSAEEAREYVVAYVLQRTVKRESYGATLIGLIGEQAETWEALLERIGPNQVGILVEAARRRGTEDTHRKAVKVLWSLSGKADPRELLRAGEGLLASPWLDEDACYRLAEIPELASIRTAFWARGAIDVPGMITTLETCVGTRGCTDGEHAGAVEELAKRITITHLPLETLARAAIRHHQDTNAHTREQIYAALTSEETARLSVQASADGEHEEAARIVASARQGVPEIHPETLRILAARGSAHALDRNEPQEIELVLESFQPLHGILRHPRYAGMIAERAAGLEPEDRETFYRLLWEWETDLPALLEVARNV